ncbi:ribonucleotide-diphosphate reductase subunit beta [Halalkalibacterium halodurans]|uniref:Ribonucleoside-diphosphate reductase subunit beta n=2 Tax=Halalkalibacterium halodurans (strain ATCC BAA-125 / DSM 18197 / FERM 7344 / JCM 9153 / C-125) TaxID=272558 RepID=RIR2_HALH5|nr:ribonucleotide-diphosphate reductase subunit beta [Halalkalibacterium halodurans]Q9KFH7.1 RecName: Full=Ribonucleoside-diphosphate reductase subunit beta; AltName: Full=Ribonucleotide reductase small subunit [Halalkalibacterium halodurans C-125]MDY7221000.1 ribonucleotide-diphosphate reductase subunit beta [Halalkalibacterium halodurans]MDY7240239.1 ribonucleotide-diphosphate reductase subunit beta [Halalkalibacterium halodurans]MED4079890.1 ribonucleotide-diphosphate reductase subunit beta 
MEQLQKRKIYDTTASNASTGILNGKSSNVLNWDDVRFSWAYPLYKNMLANFWTPFEINMSHDAKQFPTLTETEQEAFKKIIGLLAFLDSVQTDYSMRAAEYLTDSSLAALMSVLSFQEVVHNQSYSYVLSSLVPKATQDEIFEYWKHDDVLKERNEFIIDGYEKFVDNPTPKTFLESIVYDVILEGLNFYSGFAFFYNLARNQKMVSTSTMINYINRDEQLHVYLFTNIFKELLVEFPELNTEETKTFVKTTLMKAADLEKDWFRYIIGDKIPGINPEDMETYISFIANKRAVQLGMEKPYPEIKHNPMKWIRAYEDVNSGKSDFFEQKSRQYAKVSADNGFDEL